MRSLPKGSKRGVRGLADDGAAADAEAGFAASVVYPRMDGMVELVCMALAGVEAGAAAGDTASRLVPLEPDW